MMTLVEYAVMSWRMRGIQIPDYASPSNPPIKRIKRKGIK